MIIKSFEIEKKDITRNSFYLFYGENEGLKNHITKRVFEEKFKKNIFRYDEKEILNNEEIFYTSISNKSFFDNKKLILISRCTDKIKDIIEEIIVKEIDEIIIVLNSGILDKKSKLRSFFEKEKKAICVPFYSDTTQILSGIVNKFFREKKVSISQQNINILVNRARGDRQNLQNELNKIENYLIDKKKISLNDILRLTNLAENYNVSELIDNCLAKNKKKTVNILNENIYSLDDCILIIRTLLIKSKRLLKIKKEIKNNVNAENAIASYKPPIFWKDKETVKQQIQNWELKNIESLIYETNNIELLIKKNSSNAVNILLDFIINQSIKINN